MTMMMMPGVYIEVECVCILGDNLWCAQGVKSMALNYLVKHYQSAVSSSTFKQLEQHPGLAMEVLQAVARDLYPSPPTTAIRPESGKMKPASE